jgi:uncharacterized membrane protein YccC
MRKPAEAGFRAGLRREGGAGLQAAVSHIAVSNALLIIGMFMPKLALAAFFEVLLGFSLAACWATSVARSHDPISWERATEKNKNT